MNYFEVKKIQPEILNKDIDTVLKPWHKPPKEADPLYQSDTVTVAGANWDYILEYTVPDGKVAYIKRIGHSWNPNSTFYIYFDSLEWIHYTYQLGSRANPYIFPEFAKRIKKSFQMSVTNADTINHDYECVIDGWIIPQERDAD